MPSSKHLSIAIERNHRVQSIASPLKMFAQRQIGRLAPRFAANVRTPATRSTVQRRLMSSAETTSSTEPAFVRERRAVKEHAAGSTSEPELPR